MHFIKDQLRGIPMSLLEQKSPEIKTDCQWNLSQLAIPISAMLNLAGLQGRSIWKKMISVLLRKKPGRP